MLGYYQWLQHGRKSLEHGCVELVDVFQANWFYNISRTHLKAAHHGSSSDEQVCTKATVCQLPWNDINDLVSIRPWPWRCAFMPQNFFCRTGTHKIHVKKIHVWNSSEFGAICIKGIKFDCQAVRVWNKGLFRFASAAHLDRWVILDGILMEEAGDFCRVLPWRNFRDVLRWGNPLMLIDIYWHWYLLIFIDIYWYLLTFIDVCWFLLSKTFEMRWRMKRTRSSLSWRLLVVRMAGEWRGTVYDQTATAQTLRV